MHPIVIIGAGMAAYSVARELRRRDKSSRLLIISADRANAYAKPMLSNALALGKSAQQLVSHSADQMAAQLDAVVVHGSEVLEIDAAAHTIRTASASHGYATLVLALGATPIRLALAGDAAEQVMSVNHLDDYALLRTRLAEFPSGARVTILGAGLIGCEFADDLARAGHHVTLVDPNRLPLSALAAPALSRGLLDAWTAQTIALRLGTTAASVNNAGAGRLLVTLADGSALDADIVLSAVGLRPSIALAKASALATRRGIVVDAYGQTSAPDIYALGDCAEYAGAQGGGVLPYVAPLLTAARAIASTLTGTPTQIVHGNEAVVVKTPSYRLALAPPAPGTPGTWHDSQDGERLIARFVDDAGVLRGFGLSAHTPALRQSLQAALGSAHS